MSEVISEQERESVTLDSNPNKRDKDCYCGIRVGSWTAWKETNPARRFVGCRNYQDPYNHCRFFEWIDEALSKYYKGVVNDLKQKVRRYEGNTDVDHRMRTRGLKIMELHYELEAMKRKVSSLEIDLQTERMARESIAFENERLKLKYGRIKNLAKLVSEDAIKGKGREQMYCVIIAILFVLVVAILFASKAPRVFNMPMLP